MWWLAAALLGALFGACGGGSGGGAASPDDAAGSAALTTLEAVIETPGPDTLFRGGETIVYAGRAVDSAQGPLPPAALTWWVDLHHDTHTHPAQLATPGAGGRFSVPTRGETSEHIFYRLHLRATNGAGGTVEVTRDIQPRKARFTFATSPAGLELRLDGQPFTAPSLVTGVVGMERDIAAADQVRGGRRWRFDGWDHGGSASQTLFTPDSDSTYTARFTDLGPAANQPPSVSLTAPASGTVGEVIALGAAAADSDGRVVRVDFYDGDTLIASAASAPYAASWIPVVAGPASLRARAFDDLGASTDSAVAVVTVGAASGDRVAPTATLTTPAPLAAGLAGTLALVAEASDDTGVAAVEFQVDGATVGSELTAPPYRVTIDTALWASGPHLVRVRARDAAGNRSAWSQARVDFGGSRSLPAGFSKDEAFVTGLDAATAMAQAPDGRLFVAEQGGALRVVKAGVLLATAFHRFSVDTQGERGLLGVTLHPQFASNGFIYVYYTRINGAARNNRVARLVAAGDTSTGAEQVLVDLPDLSASVHNGGAMKFGADGKLYVAVGDNADTRKPQDLADPFGKMLRFNDDGSIPTDNPFFAAASATQAGLARAVWAYGLRNPFTFAIQPGSGRMHINDVGADRWEEINLGAPGANYGWPGSEGLENLGAGITPPLFTYGHLPGTPPGAGPGGFFVGFAVAGGAFYPANGPFPLPYRGNYFFADYVGRFIGLIDLANGNAAYSFGSVEGLPVDMLVGTDGALHVLTRSGITRISSP